MVERIHVSDRTDFAEAPVSRLAGPAPGGRTFVGVTDGPASPSAVAPAWPASPARSAPAAGRIRRTSRSSDRLPAAAPGSAPPGRIRRAAAPPRRMVPSSTPHLQRKVITFGSGGRPDLDTEDPASMELLDGLATDTAALQEVRRQLEDLPRRSVAEEQVLSRARALLDATGPQQQSEPMDPNLWGGLPADVKMSIILEGADTKRLLDARTLGRYARAFVDRRAQAMVPYPDEILFRLVNGSSFPDVFAKGNFTKEAIAKHENATISWEQYRKTAEGKSAQALIMRIYETEALRTTSPATPALEAEQVVFRPVVTGKWTPQIDDAWILGHIHHRHQILIVCDPTRRSNFFDEKAKRLTATGREILLALDSGYQCLANTGTIGGVSGGLLLQPPDRIVPNHLLPTTLHPVATQRLLGAFPRADAGTPLMVGAQPFGPKVAQEITKRYAQQIHDAKKNLDGLPLLFKQQDAEPQAYVEHLERCLNLLTPDSHIIPYDDQRAFRAELRTHVDAAPFRQKFGVKGRKKTDVVAEQQKFDEVMNKLFERARARTEDQ